MEAILTWIAGIGAAFKRPREYFLRGLPPASDIADLTSTEGAAEEVEPVVVTTESTARLPTATATVVTAADAEISQNQQVANVALIPPDQQEVQRRRELIRTMFNDFWSERDDKPATFVDRLNQAETYLNERLSACGELWQLDAKTRKMLGLRGPANC